MLITKKVKLERISKKYIKYSQNINDNYFEIDIKYLSLNSHLMVDVQCDNCKKIKKVCYQSYNKCTNNNTEKYYCNNKECINIKRKKSINNKYNVDNVFQLNDIKDKIKKTNIELYGCENPQQNKLIKEKKEKTNIELYGFKNPFQNSDIKKKIKITNKKRYGVEYPQQSELIRSKYSSLHRSSKPEDELFNFINNNYNGVILRNNMNTINGYELDIYLPELKLAFEFNGLYWHNELSKNKNYHKFKTDKCLEKDIQLIHIYEDDWFFNKEKIKSLILNKLNKNIIILSDTIKEIKDDILVKSFLIKNHIEGNIKSTIKIGIFYKDELVSLMILKKNKNDEYEILRYCDKLYTNIVDSLYKMFKYFIDNYTPNQVICHVDRTYSNGDLLYKLGFNLENITVPNCFYIVNKRRSIKLNKTKTKLNYKIYNSGNLKFKYEYKNTKI